MKHTHTCPKCKKAWTHRVWSGCHLEEVAVCPPCNGQPPSRRNFKGVGRLKINKQPYIKL